METPSPRHITAEDAWKITCHEAGHAIVAVRHKIAFLHVERGPGEYGQVEVGVGPLENPTRNRSQDEIARWQQFYAAGAAAEQLLFHGHRQFASSHDQNLHNLLENRWRPNRISGWERDIQSAMKLLDRESVVKVANELDRYKKLTDEQVCELLCCAPPWD